MLDCCANCRLQYLQTYGFSPKKFYDVDGYHTKINIATMLLNEILEVIFADSITLRFVMLSERVLLHFQSAFIW